MVRKASKCDKENIEDEQISGKTYPCHPKKRRRILCVVRNLTKRHGIDELLLVVDQVACDGVCPIRDEANVSGNPFWTFVTCRVPRFVIDD